MIRTTIFALLAGSAMAGTSFAQEATGAQGTGEPERPIMRLDSDGDGRVSRAEAEALGQNPMAMADSDGDGTVTRDEVIAAAVARASERARDRAGEMFDRFDENADGRIDVPNLPEPRGDRGARIDRMFDRADADSDGFLSGPEIADMPGRGLGGHDMHDRGRGGHHGKGGPHGHRG